MAAHLNSCCCASPRPGSNQRLTATGVPRQVALCTSAKPPPPIWSCTSSSSYAICNPELRRGAGRRRRGSWSANEHYRSQ